MTAVKLVLRSIAISLMLSQLALAGEEPRAEVRHGGITTMLKNRDYELVARPTTLTVYVYQDEKPASTKDASGNISMGAGDAGKVKLEPTGTNSLEAKGSFKVSAGTKVTATIALSGRKPQEVTWTLP